MLRLVRGVTPLVPKVGSGDQVFQPIWWEDLAAALAMVVERDDLAGQALDIAGAEVTSQNDLHERMSRITGRDVPEHPGARAAGVARREGDLDGRLEGPARRLRAADDERGQHDPRGAAEWARSAGHRARRRSTSGLRALAELQPEQLPSQGVGSLKRKRYWADVEGSTHTPESLFTLFRTHFRRRDAAVRGREGEPRTTDVISEGETLTLALPMRGHVQVRRGGARAAGSSRLLTLEAIRSRARCAS
jgi:NADH dehydrogenase